MKLDLKDKQFLFAVIVINLFLAWYATPIVMFGDAPVYVKWAQSFIGELPYIDNGHRSPFYSILVAGFMLIFKEPVFKVVVVFQYMLLGASVWLTFLVFARAFHLKYKAMLVALLFNFSFSSIHYANLMQTEILTLFLFMCSVYGIVRLFEEVKKSILFFVGVSVGLLFLARFNAVPLLLCYVGILGNLFYTKRFGFGRAFRSLFYFLLPVVLLVNGWCFYNYTLNHFYGLFPGAGSVPRNVTVASIRPNNVVTDQQKPILTIFLNAKEQVQHQTYTVRSKGYISVWGLDKVDQVSQGHAIFMKAMPELCRFFKLKKNASSLELRTHLDAFYRTIYKQNSSFIWKSRVVSLFFSFTHSASSLPDSFGQINLNILPSYFFVGYKALILLLSLTVFIASFFFGYQFLRSQEAISIEIFIAYLFVFGFWGINFVFATTSDASRYKFPCEPLVFGLFVYTVDSVIRRFKKRDLTNIFQHNVE